MKHRLLIMAVGAVLVLTPLALRPSAAQAQATEAAKPTDINADTYRLLNLFGDVFERIRADFVDEPTDQELVESAITGMLSSLDPHSSYLNAKNYKEMQVQTRGSFGGLGIEVTMDGGLVKVVSPIDDTPASRAGLEPGDLVTHLDGDPVLGLTLAQAVEKMRGPVGADIVLTIRRASRQPFDVTITRAIVKIRSVRSRLEGNVGYLRVTSFNEQASAGAKKALEGFHEELGDELKGIVLDLRNNPGGLLDQAVSISDLFLDKGEIVSTRSRRAEDTQRFNARTGDLAKGLPMIVLINGGSASASEIVAGALQDHNRAIVLGTKSFGKGSVQTIIPLRGHGAMRLTTARYYTPSGRSIQAVGIEPDIHVPQARIEAVKQPTRRRESDLRGALDNGKKNTAPNSDKDSDKDADKDEDKDADEAKATPDDKKGDKKAKSVEDYQLARALDLLRGLEFFASRFSTLRR